MQRRLVEGSRPAPVEVAAGPAGDVGTGGCYEVRLAGVLTQARTHARDTADLQAMKIVGMPPSNSGGGLVVFGVLSIPVTRRTEERENQCVSCSIRAQVQIGQASVQW